LRRLGHYYRPLVYALVAIAAVGGLLALFYWSRYRTRAQSGDRKKRSLSHQAQRS